MPPTTRSSARKGPAANTNTAVKSQPVAAHVNRLPNELLLSIFNVALKQNEWTVCEALELSQVCRRWRRLALSAPELWSTLPRINEEWTILCLERSKLGLIDIEIPEYTRSWIECMPAMRAVLPHLERTRSINIWTDILDDDPAESDEPADSYAAINDIFEELSVANAPNLEKLWWSFNGTMDAYYDIVPSLPEQFFGGYSATKLRDIRLEWCLAPYLATCGLLSATLTCLHLCDVRGWDNVDEMISCLRASPRLQLFRWEDNGMLEDELDHPFATARSRIHPPRCVHLAELKDLRLKGSHVQNMAIFSYLSFPETTHLEIIRALHDRISFAEGDLAESHLDDLTALFAEALRGCFANAMAQGASFDSIWISSIGGVEVEMNSSPTNPGDSVNSSTVGLLPKSFELNPAMPCKPDWTARYIHL